MQTAIVSKLSVDQVFQRIVVEKRGFTQEEYRANYAAIKQVRNENKAKLKATTGPQMGLIMDQHRQEGFYLSDVKKTETKKFERYVYVVEREKVVDETEQLKKEYAKKQKEMAEIMEKLNRASAVNV